MTAAGRWAASLCLAALLAGCSRGGPDPRAARLEGLLRPGATPSRVLYGDLDGDGLQELVVASRGPAPAPGQPPPAYLEVFAYRGRSWVRVLDGHGKAPPGPAPARMLAGAREGLVQDVAFLELVDFAGDGRPELVVGVQTVGASTGPLELWVVAGGRRGFRTLFYEATTRGGELTVAGRTLQLTTGEYGPQDAGCCPSRIRTERIGYDPREGTVRVLARTLAPARP